MNLFPRRTYFLLAISVGPHLPLSGQTLTKNMSLFVGTLKKNRSVRTIKMAVESRRDLSCSTLSQRTPFTKKAHFEGATTATAAAEEFPVPARPHLIAQGLAKSGPRVASQGQRPDPNPDSRADIANARIHNS